MQRYKNISQIRSQCRDTQSIYLILLNPLIYLLRMSRNTGTSGAGNLPIISLISLEFMAFKNNIFLIKSHTRNSHICPSNGYSEFFHLTVIYGALRNRSKVHFKRTLFSRKSQKKYLINGYCLKRLVRLILISFLCFFFFSCAWFVCSIFILIFLFIIFCKIPDRNIVYGQL